MHPASVLYGFFRASTVFETAAIISRPDYSGSELSGPLPTAGGTKVP